MDRLKASLSIRDSEAPSSPFDRVVPRKPPLTEKEQKKKKENEQKLAKKKPVSKKKLESAPEKDPRYKK